MNCSNQDSSSRLRYRMLGGSSVALALGVMGWPAITQAADVCLGGTTVINSAQVGTDNCTLGAGESVDVQGAGSFNSTSNDAIVIDGAAGGVVNTGSIQSNTQPVEVRPGGSLSGGISNGGTLSAPLIGQGILAYGGGDIAGGITNTGTITSGNDSGITLINVGSSLSGGIDNIGTITGSGSHGIALTSSATLSGGIANRSTGSVTGASHGISIDASASVTGDILNDGGITASSLDGVRVANNGSAGGNITNSATGTISAARVGIIADTNGSISGSIANAGTITAGANGVGIGSSSNVAGGISNSGTISAANGFLVSGGTVGSLGNSGTITATADGMTAINATITTNVINSGAITATSEGIDFAGGSSVGGDVINQAGGLIDAFDVIEATSTAFGGDLINNGTLDADDDGIYLSDVTVAGSIINNGTIIAGNDGIELTETMAVTGSVINTGTITATDSGMELTTEAVIAGNITNSGTITADGDGIRYEDSLSVLTGSLINSGTISAGAGQGIEIDDSATINGAVTNTGTITSRDDAGIQVIDSSTIVGGISNSAAGVVRGSTFALQISNPATPITVTNAGLLDGHVSLADGTLDLSGDSARVVGNITGDASSVVNINDEFTSEGTFSVGSLSVASNASLALSHAVTVSSGFANAGDLSIGRSAVSVTGDYTQAAGGSFEIGAKSASDYGQLTISGSADFSASGTLSVDVATNATLTNNQRLEDVVSGGTLNPGSIVVTDNSALLVFTPEIDGNTIDLAVQRRSIREILEGRPGGGSSGNGNTLDEILEGGNSAFQDLIDAINGLGSDDEIADAAKELMPTINGNGAQGNVVVAQTGANQVVLDRLTRLTGINAGDGLFTAPTGWIKPFGAKTLQENRNGISGFDSLTTGLAIGFDGRIADRYLVGGALSYAKAAIDGRSSNSSIDVDTYQATVYGSYDITADTYVSGMIGVGINRNDSERRIDVETFERTARADYWSWHGSAGVEAGHKLKLGKNFSLIPSIGADFTYAESEDYSEFGAGAASLNVEEADADSLVLGASSKLIYAMSDAVQFTASAGVTYDALAGDNQVTSTFLGGGSNFVTEGLEPEELGWNGGLGIELFSAEGMEATFGYEFEGRQDFVNHKASLNLRIPL